MYQLAVHHSAFETLSLYRVVEKGIVEYRNDTKLLPVR
jgi:hypothetical protein